MGSGEGGSTSFSRRREAFDLPARARKAVLEQAGNSFNPCIVGFAIFFFMVRRCPWTPEAGEPSSVVPQALVRAAAISSRRVARRLS
eukprot:9194784-Pyramimonas_sp.AAC.1